MKRMICLVLCLVMLACCTAQASGDPDERGNMGDLLFFTSQVLVEWSYAFNHYTDELSDWDLSEWSYILDGVATDHGKQDQRPDIPDASGNIIGRYSGIKTGPTGVQTVSGGQYSPNNTVMIGLGSGAGEEEKYWYVALTFTADATTATFLNNSFAFLLANIYMGLPIDMDDDALFDTMADILAMLFSSENIAIQMGDLILVHKILNGNQHLLAVDSVEYYDEFYYNDTDNFYVLN